MKKILFFAAIIALIPSWVSGQATTEQSSTDTLKHEYPEVVISAFEQHDTQYRIAGGVSVVSGVDLHVNQQGSFAESLNSIPGVKMDERGVGGSRRVNIRGSALRAPFGVRNIRTYLGGFALTSPDGSTPLEVVDILMTQRVEVIKGPASSIYGAGTGGALLFTPVAPEKGTGSIESGGMLGSYGLGRANMKALFGFENGNMVLGYTNQGSAGYREQESIEKEQFHFLSDWKTSKNGKISVMAYHFDGSWGLAGAIDSAAVAEDPQQASEYSKEHNAHVKRVRTRFGIGLEHQLGKVVNVKINGYGNFTAKETPYGTSPFFQGWKRENAQGFGTRALTDWNLYTGEHSNVALLVGAEYQKEFGVLKEYVNDKGVEGDLKFDNETTSEQSFAFADLRYSHTHWVVTAGISMTRLNYFNRNFFNEDGADLTRNVILDPAFSPRFSVLKSFGSFAAVHGSVSWGFSAPTLWEVVSANGGLNDSIQPETGVNFELGVKGRIAHRLKYDASAYSMQMRNTIVPREDANGVEYFENSGFTDQIGIELLLSYALVRTKDYPLWKRAEIQGSYTFQNYKFGSYISGGDTLNGNSLPGVPEQSVTAILDLALELGVFFEARYHFVGKTPLNNSNSINADPYSLLNLELGYEHTFFKRFSTKLYFGVNNVLDETYTSFYRLNGFGGKFYNPATGLNFFGGIDLKYAFDLTGKKK